MSEFNPYQPPAAAAANPADEPFNAAGRTLDAGSGWSWFAKAFALFMKQPGMWVLMFIIYLACFVLLGFIPLLGGIANMLLYPVFAGGFMLVCRALDECGETEVAQMFGGFRERTSDLMIVGVLGIVAFVALVVPVILVVGGAGVFAAIKGDAAGWAAMGVTLVLALLVALAVSIPIYMALWFAAPLVLFHGLKPVDALKASFYGCLKNIVAFLLYGVVLLVLCVVATIPLGLGWLVLGPVIFASVYAAYREIFFGT